MTNHEVHMFALYMYFWMKGVLSSLYWSCVLVKTGCNHPRLNYRGLGGRQRSLRTRPAKYRNTHFLKHGTGRTNCNISAVGFHAEIRFKNVF